MRSNSSLHNQRFVGMSSLDDIPKCPRSVTFGNAHFLLDIGARRRMRFPMVRIVSPRDIGALIREQRKMRGLDQAALARNIGASRQWVIDVEHGHSRAELGLVLRALKELDIRLEVPPLARVEHLPVPDIDIDAIVERHRGRKKPA